MGLCPIRSPASLIRSPIRKISPFITPPVSLMSPLNEPAKKCGLKSRLIQEVFLHTMFASLFLIFLAALSGAGISTASRTVFFSQSSRSAESTQRNLSPKQCQRTGKIPFCIFSSIQRSLTRMKAAIILTGSNRPRTAVRPRSFPVKVSFMPPPSQAYLLPGIVASMSPPSCPGSRNILREARRVLS